MTRLALLLPLAACTSPDPEPPPVEDTDPPAAFVLADRVDTARMMSHLEAFEASATANGGDRSAGSAGAAASVDHVVATLEQSGLEVRRDRFNVWLYLPGEPFLSVVAPSEAARAVAATVMRHSLPGEVEGDLWPVALQIPPGAEINSSTSGCQAADFTGMPAGSVALIQRGTCPFAQKVALAAAAGAASVLVFNEGQEGRTGPFEGVLTEGRFSEIPALFITYDDGAALAAVDGARVAMRVQAEVVDEVDENIIVTIAGRDRERMILVGAHLDSVPGSPGINGNGTGAALLLELAAQAAAADWQPETDVRFAWWGVSKLGFLGSDAYFFDESGAPDIENLRTAEACLNFDTLGSSNGFRFVYDGDESSGDWVFANSGSRYIESLFDAHFASVGQPTRETLDFVQTDAIWAAQIGLAWGGLTAGSTGLKTAAEVRLVGGDERRPYDPCHERACDDVSGINQEIYEQLSRGAAAVIQELAESDSPFGTERQPAPDGAVPPVRDPREAPGLSGRGSQRADR